MNKAIIDIGSNSVRLAIMSDGIVIFRGKITSQLGEGMKNGVLQKAPIIRTLAALSQMCETARQNGVDNDEIYAFATAAVRNSKNSNEFLDAGNCIIKRPIDVLSGELEGEVALLGALEGEDGAVLDIGGASSELTVAKDKKIVYSKSVKLGAVLLFDQCADDREKLEAVVKNAVKEYNPPKIEKLYAVGGTATSCALIDIYPKEYDRELTNNRFLSAETLDKIVDELFALKQNERVEKLKLSEKRAKIICGGALLLSEIVKALKLDGVTVSENDNLEGYYAFLNGKNYEK